MSNLIDRAITDLDLRQVASHLIALRRQSIMIGLNIAISEGALESAVSNLDELTQARSDGDTSITEEEVGLARARIDNIKRELRGHRRGAQDTANAVDTALLKYASQHEQLSMVIDELEAVERRQLLLDRLELDEKIVKATPPAKEKQ